MYSRKIKQMKKKLLSSNSVNSKNASASYEIGGGGGGGGGKHSQWGPRVALMEREQQEAQRRSREEQEQMYLAAKQQEIYNRSKASSHSAGNGIANGGNMYKNPYATSGIGIHTSNGFICKTNKKLMMMERDGEDEGRMRAPRKPPPPDVPLRLRIPSPDPHMHARQSGGIGVRRRHASPTATNDSLASTKTYHSSGGSSHSSSSTLSSRGSSIGGRSSLIVGSDHHDSAGHGHGHGHHAMVSGNYNINGDDDEDEPDYSHYRTRGGRAVGGNARNSPVPLPQSTISSSKNVKLINVHLIDDEGASGAFAGYYSKNIVRGAVKETAVQHYDKRRDSESKPTTSTTGSKIMQGFNMVYVPMESTKARPQAQADAEELPISSSHRRRQMVPSESGYGGFPLPEEEMQDVAVPRMPPPRPPSESVRNAAGSAADADSLLESFDSVLFKPKLYSPSIPLTKNDGGQPTSEAGLPSAPGLTRKRTPPPLPPKTRPKVPPHATQLPQSIPNPSAASNPIKSSKNLRFSEHLDVKAPSPYTTISNDQHEHESSAAYRKGSMSADDDGVASASTPNTGPASRASVYSACTTTTTLLSCGHLRGSYSTLSSLNSDQFTDENEDTNKRNDNGNSVDTSIDCPIGNDDDDEPPERVDDPNTHKSALQQLRDLSILIGGSFHTSPMIQTATATVEAGNKENHDNKYGKTSEPPPQLPKNYTKAQIRKFSTETSNDSGKGSATGSGRSRSEAGGSGSGRTNSIMQLLQNLPQQSRSSQPAVVAHASVAQQHQPVNGPSKFNRMPVNGNSKSILAALNKISRAPDSKSASHGHNRKNQSIPSTSSCSCDDSELSSCLFQPECEECQQVFGNPFEVPPELKYIDSAKQEQQQPQPKLKKLKVLTSKKELTRKNSYKLKTNPKLSLSGGSKSKSSANSAHSSSKSKSGPMPSSSSSSNTDREQLKLGYNGIGTKTQLLLSKSAHRDQPAAQIECLGCYNEQLMLANGGANCSAMMNPANLFTIDEAAEENDGTLQAAAAASSCSSKLAHSGRHGHGTAKMKRQKTKYGRGKKKSSTKKSHHHHHGQQQHRRERDDKPKYVDGNPKYWLSTDATMGWSDLESMYSQNIKNLDSLTGGFTSGGESGPSSPNNKNPPQFVNGECITCWKELMQYKYNNLPAPGVAPDPSTSYTVERTKRMFIWLNKRPKEFHEPWWEAKKQASIKWLITKAYSHMPKGSVQHPFKESKRDKSKLSLKDQVIAGLATGKLYCMALANLFQNCTPDERQSIFGSSTPLKEKPDSEEDELIDKSRNKKSGISLALSHWEIIKILSRKGIYVAQPSDMKLTEGTLRQRKPFRITAHIALIEAVMGLYAKVMLTRDRVEPIVSNLGFNLDPGAQTSEEFILGWLNSVIDTLKSYILSTNINNARKPNPTSSSSSFTHHRWLNVHPITDLRDLFDGIGLCSLFVLYFSTELSFDQVCVNEPGETLNIYESIINLNHVYDLCTLLFPQTIHHLRLTDLLYIHGYMKQNVLQLLLDIFYYTEVVPIDTVSRLTHVPLRIQL